MNILSHGMPFFRHPRLLTHYRGPHTIRSLSARDDADFRYDPSREALGDILARISLEWWPDILLFWFPENDPPPMGVENAPIPTIAMAGDWNLFYPCLHLNLARYDHVLCDKGAVPIFASDMVRPVHLFPLYAQDSALHRPCAVEKDIDILFAGAMNFSRYPERGRWLERVARLGSRYRVALIENIRGEEYNRLLNRAHIVFNSSVRGELNLRTFETMAAGSLAFLESANHEVRDWFQDGVEVVLYDEANLEVKLVYYLEHRDEAQAIARRGHARAPEFAIENRFDALIDFVAGRPCAGRRFKELPALEQAIQTFMMYHGSLTREYMGLEHRQMAVITHMAQEDPRVWACAGRCLLMPKDGVMPVERAEAALKALYRAAELAPDSAACAFNRVAAYMPLGRENEIEPLLRNVLECHSEELGEFLLGWIHTQCPGVSNCSTWNRCLIAIARKQPFLAILHAEVHVRLARFEAARGAYEKAEEHLKQAHGLDAENDSRVVLLADILWQTGRRDAAVDLLWSQRDSYPVDVAFRSALLSKLEAIGDATRCRVYIEETSAVRDTLAFSVSLSAESENSR